MKAHRIHVRTIVLKEGQKYPLESLIEEIILSTPPPPQGATTEQIVKSGGLYVRFKDEQRKHDGEEAWDWWLEKDLFATFTTQMETMRWGSTPGEIRMVVLQFIKEIRDSKETEATIAPVPVPIDIDAADARRAAERSS